MVWIIVSKNHDTKTNQYSFVFDEANSYKPLVISNIAHLHITLKVDDGK